MQIGLFRVIRALSGVFAIIMLKASLQPAVELVTSDAIQPELLEVVSLRLGLAMLGFVVFFRLRGFINELHLSEHPRTEPPLRTKWSL
jgi:hypothetical protein